MNITDATYYQKGLTFIPSVEVSGNTSIGVVPTNKNISELDYFIEKYERLLSLKFLGNVNLYNKLAIALNDIDNAGTNWQNLVKGCTYTKDGKEYIFEGLRGYNKDSFVANYIFCQYLENDNSYYATTGTVKLKSDNANTFDPSQKYINSYIEFISRYQNDIGCNEPEYWYDNGVLVGIDYYGSNPDNLQVSLEQFLKDNASDYTGYKFTRLEYINSFGL